MPVPGGYHVERRIRKGLVIAGSILFAIGYAPVAGTGVALAAGGDAGSVLGTVPVVGPLYYAYAVLKPPPPGVDNNCACVTFLAPILVDFAVQAAGASMLIAGLVGRPDVAPGVRAATHVFPTPLHLGKNGAGVGLVGVF
jgi:hypothetical protein